jgi:hypothetical protein
MAKRKLQTELSLQQKSEVLQRIQKGTSLGVELEVEEEEADQKPPNPPPSYNIAIQYVESLM